MNKKTLLSMMMLLLASIGMARADEPSVHEGIISWTEPITTEHANRNQFFNFEDGQIPAGWTNDNNYPWTVVSNAYSGYNGTYCIKSGNGGISSSTSSISTTVNYSQDGTISFLGGCWGEGTTNIWDKCQFFIDDIEQFSNGALQTWSNYSFIVPAGTHTFRWSYTKDGSVNPTGDAFFIDDVTFNDSGTICLAPSNLTVTNATATSATLSWTENGNSESWYIFYHAETDGTAAPEEESIEVFENPYTLTGLMPYTSYEAFVIPSCGVEDDDPNNILMSNIINFTTLEPCPTPQNVAVTNITDSQATVAWSDYNEAYQVQLGSLSDSTETLLNESFDNGFNDDNWSIDPTYPWTVVDGHLQSGNAGVANSTSSISLSMDLDGPGIVEFDAECRGEGTSTYWDHCDFFIDNERVFYHGADLTNAGWNHYSFNVTTGYHTFTWSYTKDSSTNPTGDYFAIDNVVVSINEFEWREPVEVLDPSYTFTGLDQFTEYYVQVQGICGLDAPRPTITSWSELVSFSTLGYYSVTVGVDPADAGTVTGGGEFLSGDTCTVTAVPNAHFYFDSWLKNGTSVSYDSIYSFVVTENTNLVAKFWAMTYYAWVNSYPQNGGSAGFFEHDPIFYYGDTVTLHASPSVGYEFVNWTVWNGDEYVSLSSDTLFTFVWDDFYANLMGGGGQQDGIEFIANFIGDCMPPTQLTASEVGPNFATLNWTELGTSESWYIFYRDMNPSPTYIPFDTIQVTENPFTLTYLQPSTSYEVYVVPSCGIEDGVPDETLMSEIIEFTTLDACPTPWNIEVTDITYSTATVSWTGYNDIYTLQLGIPNPNNLLYETFANDIPTDWTNDATYPWTIVDGHMQSGNAGISSSTSAISVTMTYLTDGFIDFDAECKGEGTSSYWDHCDFYIDTTRVLIAGENIMGWNHYSFDVTAGSHTFTWSYTKDGSVDPTGDYFAVDNIRFTKEIEWESLVSMEDATIIFTDLTPLTMYGVRVQGECEAGQQDIITTDWSQPVFFTTTDAVYYTITASANPATGGNVSGGGTYMQGASCTLTATANTGYTFTNWTKNDGTVVSNNATYTFNVTESGAYAANFTLNSYMVTASANPTVGGTVTGGGTYNHGQNITLTATPNTGYTFVNWTENGNVVSTSPNYSFTVNGARTLVANFSLNAYQITVSANPSDGGTVTESATYDYGQTCTLVATANTGYTFVNWTENGNVVSTTPTYSFTVNGARTLVANFSLNAYQITVSANPSDGGTVTESSTYDFGQTCTLVATANTGYTFVNWTENGNVVSTSPNYSFTVNGARTLVANFSLNAYQITVSANPSDGGTVTESATYDYGQTCTLVATANTGYTFVNWTENGNVVSTSPNYSFTVNGSAAYVANFSVNSYEITASANPTAGGTVTGANTYNFGEQATLTANANTGYTFINWTENGNVVSTSPSYSFTVEGPRTLVANFQLNSYEITASANPTAGGSVTGANTYNFGEQATLTANANTGYTFINWTENGNVVSTSPTYSFTVEGPRTLVANFQLNSYEITASANPTAGGSVTGANTYNFGEQATLTANANTGYTFINWTENGNVVSNSPTYSFTVEGPRNLVANFSLNSYAINASANPTAGGSVTGANTYNFGEQATLTANANTGYTFINWTENGNVVSTSPTYSFTVEGPRNLVANFSLNSYAINASANPTAGGSVTGANTYNFGEQATLTANANTGYTFINWTENGNVVSNSPTYSFTVEGPRTLVANFQLNSYEITASANPAAGGSVSGAGTYDHFETCTLIATESTGYTFTNWTENGNVVSTSPTYSFTVEGPRTLVANFQLNSYEITASANPAAGGSVSGAGTYDHFETCTLIATESTGYTFTNWTENGNVVSTSPTYSFTVEGPRTLVANFQLNSYAINASANPSAGGSVSGAGTYDHFETCTLIATESTGYTFTNWTENGNVVSNSPTYSFTVEGPRTLVANFQLNSYQITAIANPTVGGTATGTGIYNHFETCTLVATPNEYYVFTNWTKNGQVVSNDATYSFTVEGGGTYVAHFTRVNHQITALANPAEGGSVSGEGSFPHGSYCTLTATANTGYTFFNWTKNGQVVSSNPSYSFSVTEDATYVANFNLNNYTITVSADPTAGGTVSGGGAYLYGNNCTVSAMANAGYTFTNWTKNGTVVSTDASYTFTVTENANLVAHFSLDHYNITVSVDPEAGGTATGGGSFTYGETCNLSATPNTGYAFVNWTKNGSVVSTNASYSFTVTDNGDYVAHFSVARYTITLMAQPSEGGSVHGAGTYDYGHVVTLRAIAHEGYEFINWTKDGAAVSSNANYPIVVHGNAEYVANFRPYVFEIKANTNPDNSGDIEGIGLYNYGETCTLTVTPHDDYEFVNWTLNGQVVSEEESISFVVTEAREYVAHLQYVDGIDEQSNLSVTLYPNPAKFRLTIEASETIKKLEIYTIDGALVSKQDYSSDKIVISVDTLASGTYMIRLTTDSTVETRRFVKE